MKNSRASRPRTAETSTAVGSGGETLGVGPRGPVKTRPGKDKPEATPAPADGGSTEAPPRWDLRLYIAGETARSRAAIENLKKICETYMDSDYTIEVIDLVKNPSLARGDQIVALPTLVRKIPVPMRRIIGDLSDIERVLVGLDLRPHSETK